jgi:thiol:disulfide interchange protein DsbD
VGPLVNYGYEGEVLHLVELKPQPTLADGGPMTLAARAEWLVCKEVCIPEGVDLSLTLPVAASAGPDPRWSGAIASAQASDPQAARGLAGHRLRKWRIGQAHARPSARRRRPGTIRFFRSPPTRSIPSGTAARHARGQCLCRLAGRSRTH